GGLAAFEAFFSGMPADKDPNMAFVLVQHLAPDHKSLLTELIRRYTRMEVFEIEDNMAVRPNCVYVIPPGHDLALLNGTLQLLQSPEERGRRLPIDYFFESLAKDQRERAIGIVLSGTGSDGTLGVRAIKAEGGMVMAQSHGTTEFDGMPGNAIATGLVDYELPPQGMPARLIAYSAHAFGKPSWPGTVPSPKAENAMKKIFVLLREKRGHDFSQYKPSTIHRRIERRMAVHQIGELDDYVKFLQRTPEEVDALFGDMLIGVTSFFRDPETFAMLESLAIPKLFENKPVGSVIRVWTAACSTGEEAYSLAILLVEHMEARKQHFVVQVFATDIDSRAIATARAGLYPASIAANVSPERLARFFTAESDGSAYRIHKGIRDMLIFSEQNAIKDPPFSKLDLISCRNFLIYLGAELQQRLIHLFLYALNPRGFLFLGTAEGVGEFDGMFETCDRKSKIYRRMSDLGGLRVPSGGRFEPSVSAMDAALPRTPGRLIPMKMPLREMAEQELLAQVIAAGALVNRHGDIFYLHGRTGMFLEPAPGEAGINNILKMAREGLHMELTTALRKAVETKTTTQAFSLRVKTNGHFTTVNLTVRPLPPGPSSPPDSPLFLVVLEEVPGTESETAGTLPAGGGEPAIAARVAALEQELRTKEEYLQSTHDELESSNEELKSSNEEMQSVNEELQSTNEELETSKEELQSVNEELATVNTELQSKVADLTRANNDMNNLMSGTGIGTLFVNHKLQILRFTPTIGPIINLLPGDEGRPVGHIVSNLVGYSSLLADVQAVLDTLVPKEVEVRSQAGRFFTMRILPYRTLDNVIEGAVISFIDITEMVRTREELQKANDALRLAVVARDARDAITVQDLDGRTLTWNPGAVRMYGWTEAEALSMNVRDRIPPELRVSAIEKLHQLSHDEVLEPYRTRRITKEGKVIDVTITSTALLNEAGEMYAIATTERAKGGAT
ncbi:MAG: CheR family methyltransferase, partial [Verrucomicrobiota bacterium]